MLYTDGNYKLKSDFKIRTINHEKDDIDLIIPIENRVVNLNIPDLSPYILGRLQFTEVSSIMFRYNKDPNNNISTIHIMRSIDMNSALVNFEVSYKDLLFEIKNTMGSVEFYFHPR